MRAGKSGTCLVSTPGLGGGGGRRESGERRVWIWMGCHCGAPAAVGTGVLRALVAADRTGEPVRGPRAVEAGKAEIPEGLKS